MMMKMLKLTLFCIPVKPPKSSRTKLFWLTQMWRLKEPDEFTKLEELNKKNIDKWLDNFDLIRTDIPELKMQTIEDFFNWFNIFHFTNFCLCKTICVYLPLTHLKFIEDKLMSVLKTYRYQRNNFDKTTKNLKA